MRLGLFGLLLGAVLAHADANVGELAGYRLGEPWSGEAAGRVPQPDGTLRVTPAGAAPGEAAPELYVSPVSGIIGKIATVRWYPDLDAAAAAAEAARAQVEAEYPDWTRRRAPLPFGREGGAMLARLENGPHALIVFYRPKDARVGVFVELEYAPGAAERKAWKQRVRDEQAAD